MQWTFDISSGATYFTLTTGTPARQQELASGAAVLDVGEDGAVVGIEVLGPLSGAARAELGIHPGISPEVTMWIVETLAMLSVMGGGRAPHRPLGADAEQHEQGSSPIDLEALVPA